jgi:large subunit ribosomal protein L17
MRHKKAGRKLGRPTDQRLALLRNLVASVLWHGAIETTEAKAKSARPMLEQMITLARSDTLHARRQARRVVDDETVIKKLFDEIGPFYKERPGGYSRITKLGKRRGDGTGIAKLELIDFVA